MAWSATASRTSPSKPRNKASKYPNLFFVGGSVNPGGGMPMVVLCGQNVARKVVAWDSGKRHGP